jgi:predicted ATP-grasp superfamily ATP-dependent carboligase
MKRVLIVGGSTRAAAWSTRRAGLQPVCADLFADLDTRQIAEVVHVRDYPFSLPQDVAHVKADGWFYTGGIENYPDLVEQLDQPDALYGPLLGTSAAALRLIRDPFWLNRTLTQGAIPTLRVLSGTAAPPRDGTWIRKPIFSAGGRAVSVWDQASSQRGESEPFFFQARVFGCTHSAAFRCDDGAVEFLGVTQQLECAELSSAPDPYVYCGSVGPLQDARVEGFRLSLTAAAELLASRCHLRGLFGIDFIPDSNGTPWILEVNPRYTASVEIIELARQRSFLAGIQGRSGRTQASAAPVLAKQILYAKTSLMAPAFGESADSRSEWELATIADIPIPGTPIDATWPICSVMATGATRETCLQSLQQRAKDVRDRLKE